MAAACLHIFCLVAALSTPEASAKSDSVTRVAAPATVVVIPAVGFVDRARGGSFRWWQGSTPMNDADRFMAELSRTFQEAFHEEFLKLGISSLMPTKTMALLAPESLRQNRFADRAAADFAFLYGADAVATGEVSIRASAATPDACQISIRLRVDFAESGRGGGGGEYLKSFESEPGPLERSVRATAEIAFGEAARDVASQVGAAGRKAAAGSAVYRVVLKGRVGPLQAEEYKRNMLRALRGATSVRERLFSPGQVTFEVEAPANFSSTLAERVGAASLSGFRIRVAGATADSVDVQAVEQ